MRGRIADSWAGGMTAGKGWNGQAVEWRGTLVRSDGTITVGVCAREKKALSKQMVAITSRLTSKKFEVIYECDASYKPTGPRFVFA